MRLLFAVFLAFAVLGACATGNRPVQLLSGSGPQYPSEARAAGIEGYVVVRYGIDRQGNVINISVVEAVPEGVFDDAALVAVSSWRYQPKMVAGEAQETPLVESTVHFKIGGEGEYDY